MTDLKNIYAQMWLNSFNTFKNNTCEIDPLIYDSTDSRRGLTVLSYFDGPILNNISSFLDELKGVEPAQYYYPLNELHLTILSIISCVSGFKLSDINKEAYVNTFQETLKDFEPFNIYFQGITVSPSCVLIQGFPDGKQLEHFRNLLRTNFKQANLETTIDSRYKISTAHVTAVRCVKPFKNSNNFIKVLSKYRDHNFGTLEIKSLEFVFNNWYQNLSVTKNLACYEHEPR